MIEPQLDVREIQGHSLRGFDTPHLMLLGLKFGDVNSARAWLSALSHRIDTLENVHQYRIVRSFGSIRTPRVLLNVAISAYGLRQLGTDLSTVEDSLFLNPMGLNAGVLGDAVDASSKPTDYVLGNTWDTTPDLILIIGGDTADATKTFTDQMRSAASMAGCSQLYEELGSLLPGEAEHFGFRDGISQVGVRGTLSGVADHFLTLRFLSPSDPNALLFAKPGQPLVWPGQFVFGYPTQLPATPLDPGPQSGDEAPWMHNGSFLVFRRLRQDVAKFRAFVQQGALDLTNTLGRTVSSEEVGALIVGRWKDGSPVLLSPTQPTPAISGDELLVNDFAYALGTPQMLVRTSAGRDRVIPPQPDDQLAQRCPHFAHIRKVNPRDLVTDQGIQGRTLTFQMLRRGIPYGAAYPTSTEPTDRGLLFLAYQTSFKRQFQVLNSLWMNNPSAPELTNEGHDLLVGQNPSGTDRVGTLRDPQGTPRASLTTVDRWVVPTGGGFFFSPSVSFLRSLSLQTS
jgi:Dyp-type peroxidase family